MKKVTGNMACGDITEYFRTPGKHFVSSMVVNQGELQQTFIENWSKYYFIFYFLWELLYRFCNNILMERTQKQNCNFHEILALCLTVYEAVASVNE